MNTSTINLKNHNNITLNRINSIAIACNSFLESYIVLSNNKRTPSKTYEEYCNNFIYQPNLTLPQIVCGSLAIEFALKLLSLINNSEFEYTHNSHVLFKRLNITDKRNLLCEYNKTQKTKKSLKEFTFHLNYISNYFNEWRYFFDSKKDYIGTVQDYDQLVKIFCNYALSKHKAYTAKSA